MIEFHKDSGTSLIWFSTLLAVTVSIILVLSTSMHQYLFARALKDYLEQLTVASLTEWDGQGDLVNPVLALQTVFPPQFKDFRVKTVELYPGPTLQIVGCAIWTSPLPVISLETELCQEASAR